MVSLISTIHTPSNAPSTGNLIGDIVTSVVIVPLIRTIILVISVSMIVVPAFVPVAVSMSGIMSLTIMAGLEKPARLLLGLAGVFACCGLLFKMSKMGSMARAM